MARKKTGFEKKQKNAIETSESIDLQIEAFLKTGGQIEQVKSGVSGVMPKSDKKQITISTKKD